MNTARVRQSHKHPTLCTITVDGYSDKLAETSSTIRQPEHHWRLPNTDPRNEGKYLFRLHTLDVYFWTAEDANRFASAVEARLEDGQVEISDRPAAPAAHEDAMSPVVQNLENVAIQDPAYRNRNTRNSGAASTGPTAVGEAKAGAEGVDQTPRAHESQNFQPLAYNPAAPAAPEPIRHREKTPPPSDGENGTGLASAAYRDHTLSTSGQNSLSHPSYGQRQPSEGYGSLQPSLSHTASYASSPPPVGFSGPPSANAGQRTASVSSFSPPPVSSGRNTASPYTPNPAFSPPPPRHQTMTSPFPQQITQSFSPPPQPPQEHAPFYTPNSDPQESPATEILGSSYIAAHRQPLQHLRPQYAQFSPSQQTHDDSSSGPIGGYSDYNYDQQHQHQGKDSNSNEYDIHSEVYRPTVEEASKHKPSKSSKSSKPANSTAGKLEENANKVDKSVNRFFKKLEKRIG